MKKCIIIPFFILVVVILHIRCTDNVSGNVTQTGNAIGILYNPNGSRAANAKVYIVSVDHNPKPIKRIRAIDSTTTDDTGAFVVDSVLEGFYNILGSGDSGISYADSLFIDNDTIPTEVTDTLRESGTLRGVVRLQPEDDSRTVFILVFGTQTWTTPADSIGNFILGDMAEGTYHVRILTTLDDYSPLDIDLTILSGIDTTLADTIYLPFTGIPIPTGLTLSYDTLKQIVTLTWNACDTNLVKGYNVYRKHSDSDFVKINTAIITDTTYSDSSAVQDETYEYKIKAVDKSDEEGEFSEGVQVEVVSGFELIATYGNGTGTGDGFFDALTTVAVDKFGNIFAGDALNYRIQKFDILGNFITKWGGEGTADSLFGSDIRDITVDTAGNVYIVDQGNDCVKKFDNDGNFILKWGSDGTADGQFKTPYRIAATEQYIYVGDWYGVRVQKFDLYGSFISSFVVQNSVYALAATDSLIFIADQPRKQILKYSIDGSLIDSISTINTQINGFFVHNETIYAVLATPEMIKSVDFSGNLISQSLIVDGVNYDAAVDIYITQSNEIFIGISDGYIQKYRLK